MDLPRLLQTPEVPPMPIDLLTCDNSKMIDVADRTLEPKEVYVVEAPPLSASFRNDESAPYWRQRYDEEPIGARLVETPPKKNCKRDSIDRSIEVDKRKERSTIMATSSEEDNDFGR